MSDAPVNRFVVVRPDRSTFTIPFFRRSDYTGLRGLGYEIHPYRPSQGPTIGEQAQRKFWASLPQPARV